MFSYRLLEGDNVSILEPMAAHPLPLDVGWRQVPGVEQGASLGPLLSLSVSPGTPYILQARAVDSVGNVGDITSVAWTEPSCPGVSISIASLQVFVSTPGTGAAMVSVSLAVQSTPTGMCVPVRAAPNFLCLNIEDYA